MVEAPTDTPRVPPPDQPRADVTARPRGRSLGVLAALLVAVVIAIALLVLLLRHWLPALAAVGFGAATLSAYVLSLTVGFFNVREQFVSQAEVWSVITEVGCVVFGAALVFVRDGQNPARHAR